MPCFKDAEKPTFMVGSFMVTQVPSILALLFPQIASFRYLCAARDYATIQILIHFVTPCQHTPMTEAWTCFNLEDSTLFKLIYKENKDVLKSHFWCEIQPKSKQRTKVLRMKRLETLKKQGHRNKSCCLHENFKTTLEGCVHGWFCVPSTYNHKPKDNLVKNIKDVHNSHAFGVK
jgi:hypothetical protein